MPLLVKNAIAAGSPTDLRARDGVIVEIGAGLDPGDGDQVVDAGGMALVPSLLNGHTHAAMTLFRSSGDDMPLMPWLEEKIWPVEARLEPEDVYWGTRLACVEMIRSGTTRFWDMYWFCEQSARAVSDAGLSAVVGAPLIDVTPGGPSALRESAIESLDKLAGFGAEIEPAFAPHAIYTVSEESLRWIAELSSERGIPVHIHLSETEEEVSNCLAAHGLRPAEYLDSVGMLGPRTLLAHGVWLSDPELDLIAQRGATVVTNPVANMKLAVGGVFPYPRARDAGVHVALGTDGAGSNNSLDLLADAKFLALVQKHAARDAAAITAKEAFEIAVGAKAPLLGRSGRLEVGEPADFLLVSLDRPELTPGDLTANLIYAASGQVVDTTVSAGRVLMRGGVIEGADEVRRRALESAQRLGLA